MCEALESGLCFYGLEQKLRRVRGERKEERFLAQLSDQSANMALIFVPAHKIRDESQIPKLHILENPHLLPTIVHRALRLGHRSADVLTGKDANHEGLQR